MDSETYYIPVNYTDAGKLFGLFEAYCPAVTTG